MGTTSKRARRRQKAQEWLEKGASHHEHKIDTDVESEKNTDMETEKVMEAPECGVGSVTHMVRTLNDAIVAVSKDTAMIQLAYQQLYKDNVARDKALEDLTAMVKEYGESPSATRPYGPPTPKINTDVLDGEGNLRAADIGVTWANGETFLHGVRVVGSEIPGPTGRVPIMSTPYPERRDDGQVTPPLTGRPSSPETIEFGPEIITVTRPAEQSCRPVAEPRQFPPLCYM